jgi:hypothetical protein
MDGCKGSKQASKRGVSAADETMLISDQANPGYERSRSHRDEAGSYRRGMRCQSGVSILVRRSSLVDS